MELYSHIPERSAYFFGFDSETDCVRLEGSLTKKDPRGFSLVELLVVIAVIAIIAAIAIPNIAGITGTSERTKIRRNAQTIAATYNAAVTFGMINGASDVPSAVAIISAGTNVIAGNTTNYFAVDGLSTNDAFLAQGLLSFSNGMISIAPAE